MRKWWVVIISCSVGGWMVAGQESPVAQAERTPAIVISSLPANIQLIIGMANEDYYQPRVDAIHALADDLPPEQVQALMDFLSVRLEDQRLPDLEFNGLKNQLTWRLIHQIHKPVALAGNLVMMYRDTTYDETWRDYCIQFCAKYYPFAVSAEDKAIMAEALFDATANERNNRIAGTAGYMLSHLTEYPAFREDRVKDALYEALCDPECSNISKVALLQGSAELGDLRILPIARDLAKSNLDIPLRMSSIAAIGFLGDTDDLAFLTELTKINDIRIQKPALAAIEKIKSRKQD